MLLPHGTQTLLRVPFTSGTSQNGQSNEEIPIVPYLMVQDPAPYAIDIIQVSLRITYDLKPRNGGRNGSSTRQRNAGIVPDFRTGVSECVFQTDSPEMNLLIFKSGVSMI